MNKPFKCKFCGMEYNSEACYNKHKVLCEILNTDKDCKNLGIYNLSLIVIELVKSNHKLQRDIVDLKRWVQIKKQKFVVLDWLNENCPSTNNFNTFIKTINITRNDLEIIFNSNYITGITEILQNLLKKGENNSLFKSFDQKDNTIYIYKEKWEILTSEDFENIFSILTKQIMTEFKKWQDENESILYTEKFSVIYIKNVKKIVGGTDSLEKQKNIIHRNLYKYLKQNLQNIIEYEFS